MENTLQPTPIYQSYKVDDVLYAGEYPGDKYGEKAELKIQQMYAFGVRHFVDLTEECELKPYSHLLPDDCSYLRFPVMDVSVPKTVESVVQLLNRIDELAEEGGFVYIHCWGGVGRTGTIVGCYLAKKMKGSTLKDVLAELRRLFSAMPKSSYRISPETKEQTSFIAQFIKHIKDSK